MLAHVDNTTYNVFGVSGQPFTIVDFTNVTVTPTQTVIATQAGPIQLNLTFLNPIEVRIPSSIPSPFTYLSFKAWRFCEAVHPFFIPFIDCNIAR